MRLTLAFLLSLLGHLSLVTGMWYWTLHGKEQRIQFAVARGDVIAAKFVSPSNPSSNEEQEREKVRPVEHALPRLDEVAVTRQSVDPPIETSPLGTVPSGATSKVESTVERVEIERPEPLPQEKPAPAVTRRADRRPEVAEHHAVAMPLVPAVVAGAQVDQWPRKLASNPSPLYPTDALAAGVQGRVKLHVRIRADGLVETIRVVLSSGSASLDQAAMKAVERWRFEPARSRGRTVAAEVLVPVSFWIERS